MDLLQAYDQLAGKHGLNPMRAGGLTIDSQALDDPDALWQALQAHNPTEGWLQFQSWQGLFASGLPEPEPSHGLLLAAEAVCADGSSLAIGPNGQGGWTLTRFLPQPEGEQLWDEIRHIAHDGQRTLRYRRYWVQDPAQGMVQQHAIFQGIDSEGGA